MAGIRGAKNPFPTKTEKATGLFKARGAGPKAHHTDVKASAMKQDRKDPTPGRNNRVNNDTSAMRSNPALKRGTSAR